MYAQCFLVCKACFSDLKKIQSFARLNEWKEKEKLKRLTKVHLSTRLNFAPWLLISTINFIKHTQLLRQVRVLLNSQEIVGVAFVGALPVIFYLYDQSQ